MNDSLIKTQFDRALGRARVARPYGTGQTLLTNIGIISWLTLATALGIAESDLVLPQDRPAWRAWGAPIGMFQYWKVFAPNLRTLNWNTTALIEFEDGTLKSYEFPLASKMTFKDAFVKAPERVFFDEILSNNVNRKFLPSVARFLARANFDPLNKPVSITFYWYNVPIPRPIESAWIYRDRLPPHSYREVMFVYSVKPADLEDLAASATSSSTVH